MIRPLANHRRCRSWLLLFPLCLAATLSAATYDVDGGKSKVAIHVGKTGLLSFAGHEHVVNARDFAGEVVLNPDDLGGASLSLSFPTAKLQVADEGGDTAKVQEAMVGTDCLDVAKYAEISFKSTKVSGKKKGEGAYSIDLAGDLTLHGATKPLTFPVTVEVKGETLTARGELAFKQTLFGMTPVSAAGGAVKVADELKMTFEVVATARAEEPEAVEAPAMEEPGTEDASEVPASSNP